MEFEFIEPSSSTSASNTNTVRDGCILLPESPAAAVTSTATAAFSDQSKPIAKPKEPNPLTIEVDAAYFGELLALKKYHEEIIKNAKLDVKAMPASVFVKSEPPIVSDPFEPIADIKVEDDGIASSDYYDNNTEIIAEDFVKAELFDASSASVPAVSILENGKTKFRPRKLSSHSSPSKSSSSSKKKSSKKTESIDFQISNLSAAKMLKMKPNKKGRPPKARADSDPPPKVFECPICEVTIRNRISNLKRHMKMVHSEGSKVYNCSHCEFQCHRNMEMRKHLAEHKKSFECVWCKKVFNSTKGIKQHMMCHIGPRDGPNPSKKYICVHCARPFKKSAECKRHEENHSGERPHECNECGNRFRNKFDLRAHKRRVHSDQARKSEAVPCKVCGKMLSTPSNLREHMRVHSDLRPYICESCGDTFRYIYSYRIHKRIHTGEKPYPCRFCEVSFAHESTRRVHELKHKEECPKQCSYCDKRFRSSSTLNAHIQIHTKEWRFTCSQCSQGFARSGDFKRHLERHKNAEKQQ